MTDVIVIVYTGRYYGRCCKHLIQWLADVDAKVADGKPHWGWLVLLPLWQME